MTWQANRVHYSGMPVEVGLVMKVAFFGHLDLRPSSFMRLLAALTPSMRLKRSVKIQNSL